MSPVASPSPNSRNQFNPPSNKGRMMMNPQSPSSSFQHPGRPVSTQLQRQPSQPRQSPFSPQSTTPQSPHDAYPESPSNDTFSRPPSEELQFMHSPQTPKTVVQQQSPVHISSASSNLNFGQINQNQPQAQQQLNIRPLENLGGYVQAPGTPRPSFNPGQTRTTVYARPDMFSKPPFMVGGQRSDHFTPQPNSAPQSPQDQNNRQLRDLLQRQQAPTNLPSALSQASLAVPSFSLETEQLKNQQNAQVQQTQQHSQNQLSDNTFRQPLPPGMRQPRMQGMVGGQMIRSTQIVNPQRMIINPDNRPRMGTRPGAALSPQQMLSAQQQNQIVTPHQRMPLSVQGNFNQVQSEMMPQAQQNLGNNDQNSLLAQRITQSSQNVIMQQNIQSNQINSQVHSNENAQVPTTVNPTSNQTDPEGIPDSVTAELEKLEQDENVGMDGVGDILGGLGDDDDDLLDSLTADMGADFNILEYADPELDTTDDEKTNLLDSLELDESENAKEEKLKMLESEKIAKSNLPLNQHQTTNIQQQLQNRVINQIPSTVNQLDQQNTSQGSQQGTQIINQIGGQQQIVMNQQGGINNFQRQQVRIKAIPSNQIPEIQQIHQQMMLQVIF
jgi:[histone H3]-lysine4 N-trimethyltransferase MLL3